MQRRQIGRSGLIVMAAMALCAMAGRANALSAEDRILAADKAGIAFMAVCVLERDVAAGVLASLFDHVSNIDQRDLPGGMTWGLLLRSPAGAVRVTRDKAGMCAMTAGELDGAHLHEQLRGGARGTFSRQPHGRFCEVDSEPEGLGASETKRYVVNDPLEADNRMLITAMTWQRPTPGGIYALVSLVPTRRQCPQS